MENTNWHFTTPIEVRYVETDQMGFVHHSNYAVWFELARIRFFAQHGFVYHVMEQEDCLIPVLELNLRFVQPLRFGDQPELRLRLLPEGTVRFRFIYEVLLGEQITCVGESLHAVMTKAGRPTRIPKNLKDLLQSLPA